ncbi:hypothetical protein [Anaerostipes caccae]
MEQIGFFEDIGCKKPPEPKRKKKKSKPLPGGLPELPIHGLSLGW